VRSPFLKKSLGQHHLTDPALCRPLVEFLRPEDGRVLEIGPGGGVLTTALLAAGARVLAWEVDLEWAAILRQRLPDPRLEVVVGDALDIPWTRMPAPTFAAGNLPYNIATALIERLFPHHGRVPRAAFLVQKEVADRLVASSGDPAYGSLSVLTAAYAEARLLGRVKRGSFRPPPKVEGAFVGFTLRPPPLPASEMPAFLGMVRLAFNQRRKTLRNALAAGWGREKAEAVLAAAGVGERVRAEEVGLSGFLAIHKKEREVLALASRP
jgi:16S rRNA (adenine1518-N6/adenine1519-N6)-dimethyltransferase